MTKADFVDILSQEIEKGQAILDGFINLRDAQNNFGDGMAVFTSFPRVSYNREDKENLKSKITIWERRVYEILKSYWGEEANSPTSEFMLSEPNKWIKFKESGIICMNRNITTLKSYVDRIDYLPSITIIKENNKMASNIKNDKPYKVFISHSGEDVSFVNELVCLLEFLGVDSPDKLLCSSIEGYQIPVSADFADYIMNQFYEYNLFVIIVHSSNYYASPYCLNEMGAAWVLKTDFFFFLVRGFDYNQMNGVINQNLISAKVDAKDAPSRLNELKDRLVKLFKPKGVNPTRWEKRRDDFLEKVNALKPTVPQTKSNLFASCYIPIFNKVFSLIDMPQYPYWTYNWAMSGTPKIDETRYEQLVELREFLLRLSYNAGYGQYDNLLKNLNQMMSDYIYVCDIHLQSVGENLYTVEKFYKAIPDNPNYHEQLSEYKEYLWLLSDMTLEMTRLLNLLLERIRANKPDFMIDDGVLVISSINREYTEYLSSEKADSPYPGLEDFVKIRASRNYFYSKTTSLNNIIH